MLIKKTPFYYSLLLLFIFLYHLTSLQVSLHSLNTSNSLKIHPQLDTVYVAVLVCLFVLYLKRLKVKQLGAEEICRSILQLI